MPAPLPPSPQPTWIGQGWSLVRAQAWAPLVTLARAAQGGSPGSSEPWAWLGLVALIAGRAEQGKQLLGEAHRRGGAGLEILELLAPALQQAGREEELLVLLEEALEPPRAHAGLCGLCAALHQRRGRLAEAERWLRRGLAMDPEHGALHNNLGQLLAEVERRQESLACFERAGALLPAHPDVLFNLAAARMEVGQELEAEPILSALPWTDGQRAWARALRAPVLTDSPEQALELRQRCMDELDSFVEAARGYSPAQARAALRGVVCPFRHHYLLHDDLPLQRRVGGLLDLLVGRALPHLQQSGPRRPGPPRLGVATGHWRRHTVSRLFGGWVQALSQAPIELYAYDLGPVPTSPWQGCRWRRPGPELEERAAALLSDDLDALVYPELGMESGLLPLGALRLARRQAMAWGHPVTSGIPAMDLFLSSDWMEPPDGQDRYTETLIRLPGSSLSLPRPGAGASPPPLPEGPLALCAQSLFKLRPQDDQLWAELAARAPQARLLFIAHPAGALTERFRSRLGRAFSRRGLRLDRHVHLLPRLDEASFSALQRGVDLWLDAPGWSGGMTALEAIGAGLPLLTSPEGPMRSRHSAGLLQGMGCAEGICGDGAALVSQAATLLAEPELRALHARRCLERSSLLYDQPAPVDALLQALLGP